MKLSLIYKTEPVNVFSLEIEDLSLPPEVYIDDKRCPPALEAIILRGLDSAMNEYLDNVELLMALTEGK